MRYVVTTLHAKRGAVSSAKDVVSGEPGVKLLAADNPDMVTIDADEEAASQLREKLRGTHFVEAEVRRSLT